MIGYLARRILALIPVALGVATLTFALIHLVPGDPVVAMLGEMASPADITGMRHELGGSRRKLAQELDQFLGAQMSGESEAGEMIGGAASVAGQDAMEPAAQEAERPAHQPSRQWDGARVQRIVEGAPDPGNAVLAGKLRDGLQHRRQQMRVLVGVEVGGPEAGFDDPGNLPVQFPLDGHAS